MKIRLILLLAIVISLAVYNKVNALIVETISFTIPLTLAANSTTNLPTTAYIDLDAVQAAGRENSRITLVYKGAAGSTNSNITAYFATSADTVTYDNYVDSNIKLVSTPNGTATIQKSDWVNLVGVKRICVARLENNSGGNLTNLAATVSFSP